MSGRTICFCLLNPGLVAAAVKYLLLQRERGVWGTTQSTAVAFQALNQEGKFGVEDMTISIDANGKRVRSLHLTEEDQDMLFYIDLRPYLNGTGTTDIVMSSSGSGTVLYQVIYEEHRPWTIYEMPHDMPFEFSIDYDTDTVEVGDWVKASVHLRYTGDAPQVQMMMVDLKAPTGLTFRDYYFQDLLYDGVIQQYDNYGSTAHLYIDNVDRDESIDFQVEMYAQHHHSKI